MMSPIVCIPDLYVSLPNYSGECSVTQHLIMTFDK